MRIALYVLILILSVGSLHSGLRFSIQTAWSSCPHQDYIWKDGPTTVSVSVYRFTDKPNKTVLVLPPTGGKNILDIQYAKAFCRAGFEAVILNSWTPTYESLRLDLHQLNYEYAQAAIGVTLKNVSNPLVGALGTSLGGLHTVVATSLYDQIRAAFLITWGGPTASVIARSDQEAMVQLKTARFDLFKFKSLEEYEDQLSLAIILDPFKMPKKFENKYLGVAIANADNTVPTDLQLKLKSLWNPQTTIEVSGDHKWAIIKTWLLYSNQIIEFFESGLQAKQ